MIRDMVKIDEALCTGCGDCVPGCHEGALQIIDGKARLISDLMCDGLGACIGHCPVGAIEIEKREAEAYDEAKVMELMVPKGKNTVIAHLVHLKEHKEFEYLKEGVQWMRANQDKLPFKMEEVTSVVHNTPIDGGGKCGGATAVVATKPATHSHGGMQHAGGGCPGSAERVISKPSFTMDKGPVASGDSELRQWPVQLHLVSPMASYFRGADVVLAADCVAFAMGNFHARFLKGKTLAIACPKLDSGMDVYRDKLVAMINDAKINTLTVVIMQVPCCGGLMQVAKNATEIAARKIPVKRVIVSVEGEVLEETWV